MTELGRLDPRYARDWQLRSKYQITLEDYSNLLAVQEGKCAICGTKPAKGRSLAVDHCHSGGHVRGLLCIACNRALGYFKDSIENLESATTYLRQHDKEKAA